MSGVLFSQLAALGQKVPATKPSHSDPATVKTVRDRVDAPYADPYYDPYIAGGLSAT